MICEAGFLGMVSKYQYYNIQQRASLLESLSSVQVSNEELSMMTSIAEMQTGRQKK